MTDWIEAETSTPAFSTNARIDFLFRMLQSAREIGRPQTVAHYVKKIEESVSSPMDQATAERLASAKDWVVSANEYERLHGKESLLDRSHPTHLRALRMLGMAPSLKETGVGPLEQIPS